MWKEGGEIQLLPGEEGGVEDYGVFSMSKERMVPLKLAIEVRNRSAFAAAVTGAYLDVRDSVTDMQPAIQLAVGSIDQCSGLPFYRPTFRLENFGWGTPEQATINFTSSPGLPSSLTVGRIERRVNVNLEPAIRSAGADVIFLAKNAKEGISCRKPKSVEMCLQELKARGTFGSLDVRLQEAGFLIIRAAGRLEYHWSDASGKSREARSPFVATLPLGFLRQEVECGEGAGREPITTVAQQLRVDASNYRVPLSFRTTVPPGRTTMLTVPIKVAKSSEHNFTVVLQLADGRQIGSQPINLLYYVPSWFAESSN